MKSPGRKIEAAELLVGDDAVEGEVELEVLWHLLVGAAHLHEVIPQELVAPAQLLDDQRHDEYREPRGDLAGAARAAPRGGSATRAEIRENLFLLEP